MMTFLVSFAWSFAQVRKEKLGDRITALHQLVSPFGKVYITNILFRSTSFTILVHPSYPISMTIITNELKLEPGVLNLTNSSINNVLVCGS
jgi:hypothetical protein